MIRVAIADDHTVVRQGLRHILETDPELKLVGEAANGHDTLKMVREKNIDVLTLDISMPGRSGLELIGLVKAEKPKLPVLVLSMHNEELFAVRTIKAGASGYLTKGCEAEELIGAIKKLAGGRPYITLGVAEHLALEFCAENHVVEPHKTLSDREFQIFKLIVEGHSIAAIADALSLSSKSVSTYKARMLQKMRLGSSADLIHYAIEHGLSSRC
ncbi:MAG: DNA-binding response regulator [Candidatus Accumulibacter sp. 66-26]|nr:response regulator transcription factor [Accumulibacter sp.]OJW48363.1 MAG: DNA-binding response regulator [Candidatus Accumulibacter sp. 66-26]